MLLMDLPRTPRDELLHSEYLVIEAARAPLQRVHHDTPMERQITTDQLRFWYFTEFSPSWNGTDGAQPDGRTRGPKTP